MGRDRSRSHERRYSSSSDDGSKDLWRAVKDDPNDFDAWTKLLQYVEQKDDLNLAGDAYEAFLKLYPFCYGYWRKFAEFEKRHKRYEKALNVYERGLREISLSVDLWMSYIAYIKDIAQGQRQADAKIRAIYLRALDACGTDFRSDKLWTQYIDWEIENKKYQLAAQMYDIILSTPTQNYANHFERFQAFVNEYEPDEILSAEEYEAVTDIVYDRVKHELDGAPLFVFEEYEEDIPEHEIEDEDHTRRLVSKRKHISLALDAYREEIIERRSKLHRANTSEVIVRIKYENAIKRPYFHVKALERDQLQNWHKYLDFEISEKKKKRIQVLFERCIIACALYDEMWIKYASYCDSIGEIDRARELYKKATDVHCSRKPGIHLAYSLFEEKHGDSSAASAILYDFDRRHPGYAAISMRKIHVSRRKAGKEKSPDYASTISKLEKLISEPGNSRRVASFYALKLSRIHLKLRHDRKSAEKVLKNALSRDKDNLQLYMGLVDVAFSSSRFHEHEVVDAFDYAIYSKHLPIDQRFLFSQRKLDFLEELGNDATRLHDHYIEHLSLEKQLDEPAPTLSSNLKRKAEYEDLLEEKRAKIDEQETFTTPNNLGNGTNDNNVSNFYPTNIEMSYESSHSTPLYTDSNSIQC